MCPNYVNSEFLSFYLGILYSRPKKTFSSRKNLWIPFPPNSINPSQFEKSTTSAFSYSRLLYQVYKKAKLNLQKVAEWMNFATCDDANCLDMPRIKAWQTQSAIRSLRKMHFLSVHCVSNCRGQIYKTYTQLPSSSSFKSWLNNEERRRRRNLCEIFAHFRLS